jgi:hypothetical protein
MANILEIKWLKNGLSGSQTDNGSITHSEIVIIVFDDFIHTALDAISHAGLRAGQPHRKNNFLHLKPGFTAEVHEDDNAKVWKFDLEYSTRGFSENAIDEENYRPSISISPWSYPITVTRDKVTGEPILLPTGEPYESAFIEQVSAPIVTITVKEYSAHIDRISLIGSINESFIRIAGVNCPKYCAMLADYSPEPHYDEDNYLTFQNTFKIKMKFFKNKQGSEIGFKLETLASSFNELIGGKLTAIKVADPEFPTDRKKDILAANPIMVSASGKQTSSPHYQEWVVHDTTSFSRFGLPSNYTVS